MAGGAWSRKAGDLRPLGHRAHAHATLFCVQVDTFFVTAPNVGAMQRLKIRSSNTGLGAAWHLAKVRVRVRAHVCVRPVCARTPRPRALC